MYFKFIFIFCENIFHKYNFSSHFSVLLRLKNYRFPLDSAISPRGNGICAEASAPESP